MSNDERSTADRDFEHRAHELFDASVAGLDAGARSRLNRSRQHALDIAAGERRAFGVWRTGATWGAVAASVLVAVLLWRGAGESQLPVLEAQVAADEAPDPALELLAANEDDLGLAAAEEELEFYAWIEAAAATGGAGES
jgi:hypothetical protein